MLLLTYVSSVRAGPVEIDAILATARRRNAANALTGLLIHDGRRFLQVLEGPSTMVEASYARIRMDDRHRGIVTLAQRIVTERAFGDEPMASHLATAGRDTTSLTELVDHLVAQLPDAAARELFRSFARGDRKAA